MLISSRLGGMGVLRSQVLHHGSPTQSIWVTQGKCGQLGGQHPPGMALALGQQKECEATQAGMAQSLGQATSGP